MDVLKPEDLTQGPDDDKELSRDSYLSSALFIHEENCSGVGSLCKSPMHVSRCCKAG
jgi:hypothetical protein